MASLPFSGLSLEPDGNAYHDVYLERMPFEGEVKITIEGKGAHGEDITLFADRVFVSDERNAVAVATVTDYRDEGPWRPDDDKRIHVDRSTIRLVIDATINPDPAGGSLYTIRTTNVGVPVKGE